MDSRTSWDLLDHFWTTHMSPKNLPQWYHHFGSGFLFTDLFLLTNTTKHPSVGYRYQLGLTPTVTLLLMMHFNVTFFHRGAIQLTAIRDFVRDVGIRGLYFWLSREWLFLLNGALGQGEYFEKAGYTFFYRQLNFPSEPGVTNEILENEAKSCLAVA